MKITLLITILLLCFVCLQVPRCIGSEILLIEDKCVLQQYEGHILRSVSRIIDPELGVVCYEYDWGNSNGVSTSCVPFSFLDLQARKQLQKIIKDWKEDRNKLIKR